MNPFDPNDYRDSGLVDSAANRPFQSAFECDVHDTIHDKAAALFHSLVCNHCFSNGNKRTAVLAVDMFLMANDYYLVMNNVDIYTLAKDTARSNEDGVSADEALDKIARAIESQSFEIKELLSPAFKNITGIEDLYYLTIQERDRIRDDLSKAFGPESQCGNGPEVL